MRFCETQGCDKPVWGTDKLTRTGYCKNHQHLRTDIDKSTIIKRAIKKQRQSSAKRTGSKLRSLAGSSVDMVVAQRKIQSKSQLLVQADKVFGDWIKQRDKDKHGQANCPCCWNDVLVEVNGKPNPECNILHFVDRDVYSLRFDEDNAAAGHSWCNRNQHYNPKGKEYQNFRERLVEKLGESVVAEMELQHRKINKITEEQLRTVIELYSTN